jgi:hypothetical protein
MFSQTGGTEILLQFLGLLWSPDGHGQRQNGMTARTAELHSLGVTALGGS